MDENLEQLVSLAQGLLTNNWGSPVRLGSVRRLSESGRRNLLVRCDVIDGPKNSPTSVIIKRARDYKYDPDDPNSRSAFGLFRDWAGLEFLSKIDDGSLASPAFYGGDRNDRFFVMEDLGSTMDIDFALTQSNAKQAKQALVMLAETLGRMHALSSGREKEFQQIRDSLGPGDGEHRHRLARHARSYLPALSARFETLGVTVSPSFSQDVEHVASVMADPGPFLVYTHADACPDNVILTGDRVRLFDYEFGNFRHALLDGVYGRFRFPTCWCVRDIPEPVVAEMELVYRRELIKACPVAADDAVYFRAVADGCAYWMLENLASLFDRALQYEEPKGASTNRQRILMRLDAFCDVATRADHLPGMIQTFEHLLEFLRKRWADNMPLYDSFAQQVVLSQEDTHAIVDAVKSNDTERSRKLIDREPGLANAKASDADQTPVLYLAVQTKSTELVSLLLSNGADPLITTRTGWSVIAQACAHSTTEIVDLLIDRGADLNSRDMWGTLPIYGVVTSGVPAMLKHILSRGARPDLKMAIDLNQPELVRQLLHDRPLLARTRFGTGVTLLHDSARIGDSRIDTMKLLLAHGAGINVQSNWDATPLHLAAFNGHVETVRFLLKNGADTALCDHLGFTPFELAMANDHTECAELLKPHERAVSDNAGQENGLPKSDSTSILQFANDSGSLQIMEMGDLFTGMNYEGSGSIWLESSEASIGDSSVPRDRGPNEK